MNDILEDLKQLHIVLEENCRNSNLISKSIKEIKKLRNENENLKTLLIECNKCNGAGWVWHDELDIKEELTFCDDTHYTCDRCNGIGYVKDNNGGIY